MFEKFNGIIFFAIFIIHFIGFAYYGFRCVFQTKSFLAQYGMDDTGAIMTRFFGSIFLGSTQGYIRWFRQTNGLNDTWLFNVIFLQTFLHSLLVFIQTKLIN